MSIQEFTKKSIKVLLNHIPFYFIWFIFFALFLACWLGRTTCLSSIIIIYSLISIFVVSIILSPMHLIYGLVGAKGSVRRYLLSFSLFILIFWGVYYCGFFKNAGITYDVNPAHIEYSMFEDSLARDNVLKKGYVKGYVFEQMPPSDTMQKNYQKIDGLFVLRSTILTSLMQQPSGLFSSVDVTNTFGKSDRHCSCRHCISARQNINARQSDLLHCLVIFQIFISWIFFGVFISLIYKKIRNE